MAQWMLYRDLISHGNSSLARRLPRLRSAGCWAWAAIRGFAEGVAWLAHWAGLRGAVPVVLATIPVNARVPGATRLFDIVFIIVVISALAQGPTLPWVARGLKVTAPGEPLDMDVEAVLEALPADLLR